MSSNSGGKIGSENITRGIGAMAKSKKTPPAPDEGPHLADVAEYFTLLLSEINPQISKEQTFEILMEALSQELDPLEAAYYGKWILGTAATGDGLRDIH